MRARLLFALLLLPWCGCGKGKSTGDLLADLNSGQERERIAAVRLLPDRKKDAAHVVPALMESLKDKDSDVRRGAALGLGSFADAAEQAIPALQAARTDPDARVREAATIALSRIDPARFPAPTKTRPAAPR